MQQTVATVGLGVGLVVGSVQLMTSIVVTTTLCGAGANEIVTDTRVPVSVPALSPIVSFQSVVTPAVYKSDINPSDARNGRSVGSYGVGIGMVAQSVNARSLAVVQYSASPTNRIKSI
jgi:hypothetical protein